MVDQPEGRPKSPGPGKIKPAKKHVSKPYERPSSSRGVLARVRELITPVTPAWLKDLVLKPPTVTPVTSVTDHLEITVNAQVQAEEVKEEKPPAQLTPVLLTNVTLPLRSERSNMLSTPKQSPIHSTPTRVKSDSMNRSTLEDTMGDLKWSSMRPSVKEKYSFNMSVFNTPNRSSNSNKSLNKSNRVSFGGNCSLQRSLLQKRGEGSIDNKRPIKVRATPRSVARPTVTSTTAKKILQQLEALSKPLGHLPSSRPSTPGSRPLGHLPSSRPSTPGSRPATPLSRSSTPYNRDSVRSPAPPSNPFHKPDRDKCTLPTASLSSSTPRHIKTELNGVRSLGGKMRREKQTHYKRVKEEDEEEEGVELPYDPVEMPDMSFKPILMDNPLPIKIVNQPSKIIEDHTPLKEVVKTILSTSATDLKLVKESSEEEDSSDSSRNSYSFTAPLPLTNTLVSSDSVAEFSFDNPSMSIDDVLKAHPPFPVSKTNSPQHGPPGSWSCVPCKLSNPGTMTRCSGCEAPNPATSTLRSPFGIKRAPITPMKPPVQMVKVSQSSPLTFDLTEEPSKPAKEPSKPLVTFNLNNQDNWSCGTCLLSNKNSDSLCAACQSPNPKKSSKPEEVKPIVKTEPVEPKTAEVKPALGGLFAAGSLAKFAPSGWSCDGCMLNNADTADKCIACSTAKPGPKPTVSASSSVATVPGTLNLMAKFAPKGWSCSACMLNNDVSANVCKACGTANAAAAPAAPAPAKPAVVPPGPLFAADALKPSGWNCTTCLLSNPDDVVKCKACETLKPGAKEPEKPAPAAAPVTGSFKFGAGPATSTPAAFGTKTSFDFGSSTTSQASTGFTFGAAKPAEDKPAAFGAAPGGAAPGGFTFGAAPKTEETKPAPAFNFGGTEKKEETKAAPAFNFGGAPKTEAAKAPAAAPAFNFVGSTAESKPAPAFNFGGTSTESKPAATPAFNFGGAPKTEESKPVSFNFGGAPKPTESAAPAFNFGGTAKPAEPKVGFSFGAAKTEPAAGGFNFGGASQPATTTGLTFGGATPAPAFNFGGTPQVDNKADVVGMDASSRSPKHFGAADTGGFSFPTTASTTPAFSFGAQPATSTVPTFGGATGGAFGTTPAFGSTSTPSFGSTPAPSFGSTPAPSFGAAPTPAATPSFNFGGSAPAPAATFGAPATSTAGFNFGGPAATTPAFGAAAPANNGFNFSGPTPSTFGASAPAPTFGATPAATFGASTTPSSGFNFGGTATESKPAPSFNFGGNNTNTTPSGGFNFSAPGTQPAAQFGASTQSTFGTTAPPQFGTPSSNNMFSPSTSSSGRKIKKAVRRTKR